MGDGLLVEGVMVLSKSLQDHEATKFGRAYFTRLHHMRLDRYSYSNSNGTRPSTSSASSYASAHLGITSVLCSNC